MKVVTSVTNVSMMTVLRNIVEQGTRMTLAPFFAASLFYSISFEL